MYAVVSGWQDGRQVLVPCTIRANQTIRLGKDKLRAFTSAIYWCSQPSHTDRSRLGKVDSLWQEGLFYSR